MLGAVVSGVDDVQALRRRREVRALRVGAVRTAASALPPRGSWRHRSRKGLRGRCGDVRVDVADGDGEPEVEKTWDRAPEGHEHPAWFLGKVSAISTAVEPDSE